MENNKIVGIAITAAILVILLGTVLTPVIDIAQDESAHTYNNSTEGLPSLIYEDAGHFKPHTITIDSGVYTIDGNVYTFSSPMVMCGTDTAAAFNQAGGNVLFWANGGASNTLSSLTITCDNGVMTYSTGGSSATLNYTYLYIVNEKGTYSYTTTTAQPHVDSKVSGWFVGKQAGEFVTYHDGNAYVNGALSETSATVTTSPARFDALTLNKITVGTATLINGIVPTEVVASYEGGKQIADLYGILPVLVIVSIIASIATVAITRKS